MAMACLLVAAIHWLSGAACAQVTEISRFSSHIHIQSDASIVVRERIVFRCEDGSPPPERSFPLTYAAPGGKRVRFRPAILSVHMDATEVAHHIREDAEANVLVLDLDALDSGSHEMLVEYSAKRQLSFLRDSVELYWPVTGYEWAIPVDQADAQVELPLLVNILAQKGYAGPEMSRGDALAMGIDEQGIPWFRTTRRLYPGDGLAVAIRWPKGFVAEPWVVTKAWYTLRDNLGLIMALLGVLLLAVGQCRSWSRLRSAARLPRCSAKPPTPPGFASPAGLRAALGLPLDAKCLAATMLSLALSGVIRLSRDSGYLLISRTETSLKTLGRTGRTICKAMFETAGPDVAWELPAVSRTGIRSLNLAFQAMRRAAGAETLWKRSWFLFKRMFPSLALSLIILCGLAFSAERFGLAVFLLSWLVASHFLVLGFFLALARPKHSAPERRTSLLILTMLPFAAFELLMLLFFSHTVSLAAALILAATLLLNTAYFMVLRGNAFIKGVNGAQLAKFKARLEAGTPEAGETETTDADTPSSPSLSPFPGAPSLPYALVLNMEEQWDRFFKLSGSCLTLPEDADQALAFLLSRLCEKGAQGFTLELTQAIETNPPAEPPSFHSTEPAAPAATSP